MRTAAVSAFLALALATGCGKRPDLKVEVKPAPPAVPAASAVAAATATSAPAAAASASASGTAPAAPAPAPPPQLATISGKVLETLAASDYTYMRLKTKDGETWAAVTKTTVKKGQQVTVVNAAPMHGFESPSLKRKFDSLWFGRLGTPGEKPANAAAPAATAPAAAQAMPAGHPRTGGAPPDVRAQMAAQHGQMAAGPAEAADVKVPKAEGANAKTVAEVWASRAALRGQDVVVKAKVVKVTNGVMGRNWLHVRDGSGSAEKKDNDLTVTTTDAAKVGDVVTVAGPVSVDKDFGAGYAYPVILENAKVK